MSNPIISVDFDGVIHSYTSGWKGANCIPDEPIKGAFDWIIAHLPIPDAVGMGPEYIGPEVQIYTSRSGQHGGIRAMQEWFVKHGMHPAYIYDDILKFPRKKPPAFLTLDDRCICFNGRFPTSEEMLGFTSWQKRDVAGAPIGATGQFPDGKVSPDDEGELRFGVAHNQDNVILNFGNPIAWLELPRETAIQLANLLMSHAQQIRP